jgi:hypothetical protein
MRSETRNLVLALIAAIAFVNVLIISTVSKADESAQDTSSYIVSNWTINASAGAAAAFSLIIVARQKIDGLHGKTYAMLSIGLMLWLSAELLWTYYELYLQIERPFPSFADVLWLVGYGFLAYHLFATYKFFRQIFDRRAIIAVSVLSSAVLAYLIYMMVAVAGDDVNSPDGRTLLLVSLAYPVMDMVLIVPCVIILTGFISGKLTFPTWMLISLSLLTTSVADVGFTFGTFADMSLDWLWDLLYNASYLLMAGALYWYNKYFIMDSKKVVRTWQNGNR